MVTFYLRGINPSPDPNNYSKKAPFYENYSGKDSPGLCFNKSALSPSQSTAVSSPDTDCISLPILDVEMALNFCMSHQSYLQLAVVTKPNGCRVYANGYYYVHSLEPQFRSTNMWWSSHVSPVPRCSNCLQLYPHNSLSTTIRRIFSRDSSEQSLGRAVPRRSARSGPYYGLTTKANRPISTTGKRQQNVFRNIPCWQCQYWWWRSLRIEHCQSQFQVAG